MDLEEFAQHTLGDYYDTGSKDLFDKCRAFLDYATQAREIGLYQVQYRLELKTPLDHRITVVDPFTGEDKEMICFDSNSYLGLHLHPRVKREAQRVIDEMGFGTPSAQVLGGTNTYLLQLERALADLHGRDQALLFPAGYQANVGILTGLLRKGDLVLHDEFAHASVQDGARFAEASTVEFVHQDTEDLDRKLAEHLPSHRGALIVTDGMYSMHGDLAPLPALREVADKYGATLMIDDAHGLGVIGATGKGIEEHYGMEGAVDVFMGTFSKSPGAIGGYVVGSHALIEYLRFFGRGSLFTAALPAQICAGLNEALRIMHEEPEHRERLWENAQYLWQGFHDAGLQLRPLQSPIVPVRVGEELKISAMAMELFHAGIKCGIAQYPAVPRGEAMLRFTVCALHTRDDLDETIAVLAEMGDRYDILDQQ